MSSNLSLFLYVSLCLLYFLLNTLWKFCSLKSLKYTISILFVETEYFSVTVESSSNWFQAWISLPLLGPDKSLRHLESQKVKWHIYYFYLIHNEIEKNNECEYHVNLYGVPEYSNSGFSNSKSYFFLKDSWRNYSYTPF